MNHSKCTVHLRKFKVVKDNVCTNLKWRPIRAAKASESKSPEVLIELEPSNAPVSTNFAKPA